LRDELVERSAQLALKDEELTRQGKELTRQGEELARKDEELARKDEELARKNQQLEAALLLQRDSPQASQNSIANLRRRVAELKESVQASGF
jgi:hypothetical protein